MRVSDILRNADAFRRAYPSWPHPEPEPGRDPRSEVIRAMLSRRYHGVMDPVTDEAVQAVLDEMDAKEADQ
jgi:hypothetical protein